MNQNEIVGYIWGAAELLRGDYKQSKYGDIILPFTVLRRLDCVLNPTKDVVQQENEDLTAYGANDAIRDEALLLLQVSSFTTLPLSRWSGYVTSPIRSRGIYSHILMVFPRMCLIFSINSNLLKLLLI